MNARELGKAILAALGWAMRYSMPAVTRTRAMTPRDWLGFAGHVIALATAITSTVGIFNFAYPLTGGSIGAVILLLPVCIFFGFLFQIIVVSAIKLVVQSLPDRPMTAAICIVVTLVTWSGNIGTSYGSYWNWIARPSYEARATEKRIEDARLPLDDASARFAAATSAFKRVAGRSRQMAELESSAGTSCGYFAKPGHGDRWNLRMAQNEEANRLSRELTDLNASLSRSLAKLDSRDDAALASAYREARATLQNPSVAAAAGWVTAQRKGFQDGFDGTDGRFTCSDPEMAGLLRAAHDSLSRLPEPSATPPRTVQISDNEGMLMSFARLFRPERDGLSQASDFMPLAIPAIIELIMTALIVMGELERPLEQRTMTSRTRRLNPDLLVIERQFAPEHGALQLAELLSDHIVELEGAPSICFVVPGEPGALRKRARTLLLMCSSWQRRGTSREVLTPFRQCVPFAELPESVSRGWVWRSETCDLHLLPRRVADEVRRAIHRQAEAELYAALS